MTATACIFLDVSMSLEMGSQIATISKAAIALCAVEGLLSCVSSDVSLQQPRAGKTLITKRAFMLEIVR